MYVSHLPHWENESKLLYYVFSVFRFERSTNFTVDMNMFVFSSIISSLLYVCEILFQSLRHCGTCTCGQGLQFLDSLGPPPRTSSPLPSGSGDVRRVILSSSSLLESHQEDDRKDMESEDQVKEMESEDDPGREMESQQVVSPARSRGLGK